MWSGDDAAVLADGRGGDWLLTTDALVAGVHFDLTWAAPADVGWKALAVNVSDIAAMGGAPRAAVAAVVVPPEPAGLADGVADGLIAAGDAFRCPLVGGDISTGDQLVITVAVVGHAVSSGPVLRSGARPGDLVFVTGALGGAAAAWRAAAEGSAASDEGLARLLRPTPRVDAAHAVVSAGGSSMIDISDGLATDVGHLCDESGVGVRVNGSAVPLAPTATLDDALFGGDDYELCFTARNRGAVIEAFAAAELDEPVVVGEILDETTRVLDGPNGSVPLADAGWEHDVP